MVGALSPTPISRFHTLLIKWGISALVAVIASLVFLLVGKAVGMPIDNPLALVLFSVLAMTAVGWTALMTLAALGTAGLLVNLTLFVILGLPSSGGTVPIEATPTYLAWLAEFEPMHQVFLGVRSILYFDAGLRGRSRPGHLDVAARHHDRRRRGHDHHPLLRLQGPAPQAHHGRLSPDPVAAYPAAGSGNATIGSHPAISPALVPEAVNAPDSAAASNVNSPVASSNHVRGSVSTTFGGFPLVCRGPSMHCTATNGGTRTSTECPGALPANARTVPFTAAPNSRRPGTGNAGSRNHSPTPNTAARTCAGSTTFRPAIPRDATEGP